MTIEQFAAKWFTFYYFILGFLFIAAGIALMVKVDSCTCYLKAGMETDQPPPFLRSVLKYFFIFALPGFILSFFPFVWYELLFALWSVLMVFVIGLRLVHWPQTRVLLKASSEKLSKLTIWTGIAMLLIGLVVILLGYQEFQTFFLT